jgi:competence protein ComEC
LDAIFLSHGDADHYNALPSLLKRFSIDVIITPPGLLASDERGPRELRTAIAEAGVPVREAAAGETIPSIAAAGISVSGISVLHPPRGGVGGSDNANSLVLRFDHGEAVLLLPGDLEAPGTERVTSTPRPPAGGVLMAPHHGSLSEDAETILNWARPAETIVSGGKRAARMEVEQMLSRTGSGVHITARSGSIRVRIDRAGGVQVRRWLDRPW